MCVCVCVCRAYHANWLACLCPHTLLKENARKTAFFIFRIKELNQIADINFSGIHGHAYKRAFEFHVLAFLVELINEFLSNVQMSRKPYHSNEMTEQNYIMYAYS